MLPSCDVTISTCGLQGCQGREEMRHLTAFNYLHPEVTHHTSVQWPELIPWLHSTIKRPVKIRKIMKYLVYTISTMTAIIIMYMQHQHTCPSWEDPFPHIPIAHLSEVVSLRLNFGKPSVLLF